MAAERLEVTQGATSTGGGGEASSAVRRVAIASRLDLMAANMALTAPPWAGAPWLRGRCALGPMARTGLVNSETYGTLGAVVVVLIWLFVSGFAVLLGAVVENEVDLDLLDFRMGRAQRVALRAVALPDFTSPLTLVSTNA